MTSPDPSRPASEPAVVPAAGGRVVLRSVPLVVAAAAVVVAVMWVGAVCVLHTVWNTVVFLWMGVSA